MLKVLKRASAVLIMRPKSGTTESDTRSTSRISSQRRINSATSIRSSKPSRAFSLSDKPPTPSSKEKNSTKQSESRPRKPFSRTRSNNSLKKKSPRGEHDLSSIGDSAKTGEAGSSKRDEDSNKDKGQESEVDAGITSEEDMDEVLGLFNKPKTTVSSDVYKMLIPATFPTFPQSSRLWDKNAVRKPWDKWGDIFKNKEDGSSTDNNMQKNRSSFTLNNVVSLHASDADASFHTPEGNKSVSWTANKEPETAMDAGKRKVVTDWLNTQDFNPE